MWNKKIRVLEPFKSRGLTDNLNYQFVGLTIVPALDVDRGNPLGDYFYLCLVSKNGRSPAS
jgi:hypothetical protein